jgi:hypothetical protein
MSQHDYNIANQTFPATRTDLNNALGAVATNNSGNSAPSTTYANQWWFDLDDNKLYMRNKDNDAWVEILTIGATSDKVETLTATTINGIPFFADTSNNSMYTFDVSSTDDTAAENSAYGFNALDAITTGDGNTAIGYRAGSAVNTGGNNTMIGKRAGEDLTSGNSNVMVGEDAGANQTDASANVIVGQGAGEAVTTGGFNTLIGQNSGNSFDAETHNLAVGVSALGGSVNGGEFNVAIGNYSLDALTSADNNVALGYEAGGALTTAAQNVLVGAYAGGAGTMTGASNNIIGYQAGKNIDSGHSNVLIGDDAGRNLTTANNLVMIGHNVGNGFDTETHNLAIGTDALGGSVAGGEFNVAVGNYTLDALTSGDYNVAVGYEAGSGITTGSYNHLFGRQAGKAITTASHNTLLGSAAGIAITTGQRNLIIGEAGFSYDTENDNLAIGHAAFSGSVAGGEFNVSIGNYSLDALTSADHCTAVGYNAGTNNTTGIRNVFIGSNAGTTNTTGEENISIGYTTTMGGSGENRSITIGTEVQGNTDYTTIGYGSNDIRTAHGNTGWAAVSDERYKKDIEDSTAGLSFINDLQPRTFKYKNLGDLPNTFNAYKENSTDVYKNSKTNHGFIAQEVKAVIDSHSEIKDGFRMWDDRPDGSQEISETPLLPILVKAVQELSAQVTTLQQEVNTLKGE